MTTAYVNNYDNVTPSADAEKTWNDIHGSFSASTDLLDKDGVDTGWNAQFQTDQFPQDDNSLGENSVGTGDAAWVDEAVIMQTYHYADNNDVPATSDEVVFDLTGLAASTTYYIEVIGSRGGTVGLRPAEFFSDSSLTVSEGTLESQDNSSNTLSWSFTSDGSGNATLAYAPANATSFGYLNAWRISDDANFDEGGGGGGVTLIDSVGVVDGSPIR